MPYLPRLLGILSDSDQSNHIGLLRLRVDYSDWAHTLIGLWSDWEMKMAGTSAKSQSYQNLIGIRSELVAKCKDLHIILFCTAEIIVYHCKTHGAWKSYPGLAIYMKYLCTPKVGKSFPSHPFIRDILYPCGWKIIHLCEIYYTPCSWKIIL